MKGETYRERGWHRGARERQGGRRGLERPRVGAGETGLVSAGRPTEGEERDTKTMPRDCGVGEAERGPHRCRG